MSKASTQPKWVPTTLPMKPSFAEAKQYVRELMFSEYTHHLDDGVLVCFEDSSVPVDVLKTMLWNEQVLWNNFTAIQIWDEMCPPLEEL